MITLLEKYKEQLQLENKTLNSIQQYNREAVHLLVWLEEKGIPLTGENVKAYVDLLPETLRPISKNHTITLLNHFLCFLGKSEWKVELLHIENEKETDVEGEDNLDLTQLEYECLVRTAYTLKNLRLAVIIQTIAVTGIRVSDLAAITVEALKLGYVCIGRKGVKVILGTELIQLLMDYCEEMHIHNGIVFKTRTDQPLDRTNIWHAMKNIAIRAEIDPRKCHPENICRFYAHTLYERGIHGVRANIVGNPE